MKKKITSLAARFIRIVIITVEVTVSGLTFRLMALVFFSARIRNKIQI